MVLNLRIFQMQLFQRNRIMS